MQAELHCASTKERAEQMIVDVPFDLAVVSVMKNYAGFSIAEFAVNENIPVLLTTGNPIAQAQLQQFGYPYLAKPYRVEALLRRATRIMDRPIENLQRVRHSITKMTSKSGVHHWLDGMMDNTAGMNGTLVPVKTERASSDVYVGAQLRQKRVERGLTEQHLASLIEMPVASITAYELGDIRIEPLHLIQLGRLLGVPLDFFFPRS